MFTLKLRNYIAYFLKKLLKDPTSVYNLKLFLKKKIQRFKAVSYNFKSNVSKS